MSVERSVSEGAAGLDDNIRKFTVLEDKVIWEATINKL